VLRPVVALMQPRGEQPVQVGKRRARASAAGVGDLDLDQELVAAGTVPPFDLSPALRATRPTVGDLDVEDGGRPGQLPGGVRTAAVAVQVRGAAVGLDRVVQGSLHAQGVLAEAPPVADHEPGMVVEQGEQHRPSAVDERAVQAVGDPPDVGCVRLEPAEHPRRSAVATPAQLQAHEVALQGPRRGRPSLAGLDDAGDVRGRTRRTLTFEPRGQIQRLGHGPRVHLAHRRDQRVEPADAPGPNPTVQRRP